MDLKNNVINAFQKRYQSLPAVVVRAPGRVNLIGEHTDYNDGFVLPAAIDRAIWIALAPNDGATVTLTSLDFDKTSRFDLNEFEFSDDGWLEYAKGVAAMLKEDGLAINGWHGVMQGDIPIGSGLSSSAAFELAVARSFAAVANWSWDPVAMALLGQRVENQWLGIKTGIMDQMISARGQADRAMLLDCRTLEAKFVQLPAGCSIVILDTMTRRGLVDSKYNERREQCQAAATYFGVEALRDVTLAQLDANRHSLPPLSYQRARHVISENERTLKAVAAMADNDAATMGKLMNASHDSLRDDFDVSSEALNQIVASAQRQAGCYGGRMTGAGFGGCGVALVDNYAVDDFVNAVTAEYLAESGRAASIYVCKAADGTTANVQ